jgi:hypothetical protein
MTSQDLVAAMPVPSLGNACSLGGVDRDRDMRVAPS